MRIQLDPGPETLWHQRTIKKSYLNHRENSWHLTLPKGFLYVSWQQNLRYNEFSVKNRKGKDRTKQEKKKFYEKRIKKKRENEAKIGENRNESSATYAIDKSYKHMLTRT